MDSRKMRANYALGKIYRIINLINNFVYIGSTRQILRMRFFSHRGLIGHPAPLYQAMAAFGIENFKIELIKVFPCNSRAELEAEEYKILAETIEAGIPVYNRKLSQHEKRSAEVRKKMSESRLGVPLKFGCLSNSGSRWTFIYRSGGRNIGRSFSAGRKYSFWQAKKLAEDVRKQIYPQWEPNPEEKMIEELLQIDW